MRYYGKSTVYEIPFSSIPSSLTWDRLLNSPLFDVRGIKYKIVGLSTAGSLDKYVTVWVSPLIEVTCV